MSDDLKAAANREGSLLQTLKAVAWSFFGVRKSTDYAEDVAKINPIHVIVAGVIGAVLFVVGLILLIRWIVSSGVAQ